LGLIAGEAYALLSTSERVIVSREAAQAPLREALKRHDDAQRRVEDAAKAVRNVDDATPASTREVTAKAALDAANKAIIERAALPGCRDNCRQLLQGQADDARRELEAAQAEVAEKAKDRRRKAEQELATAESALKAAPLPGSATPLADHLGIQPWLLDIIAAGLLSLGVNGLGAALIALAAHSRSPQVETVRPASAPVVLKSMQPERKVVANVVACQARHQRTAAFRALLPSGLNQPAVARWRSPTYTRRIARGANRLALTRMTWKPSAITCKEPWRLPVSRQKRSETRCTC
jgi:hypothetical protein